MVSTIIVRTSDWLSVFELLLHINNIVTALHASKSTQNKFWLGVSGSCDGTIDTHQSPEVQRP